MKIFWDVLFVLFVIAMLIPTSRMFIMSNVQRLIARTPKTIDTTEQITIPENAYHWKVQSIKGDVSRFQDFSHEVIFLNFWATWCPPCVAELPAIQSLYDDYGDKIAFVLVTNDRSEVVSKFMQEKGYHLPVYHSLSQVPNVFAARSIPRTLIISKKGKIIFDKTGAAKWNSADFREKLDELIKE